MPVRTIPKNYRNVTGKLASTKSEQAYFESTLERDYLSLLEFDVNVKCFDVQPVTVRWFDEHGKLCSYTPDVLIHFAPRKGLYADCDNLLVEVKYRSDIRENWSKYKPKFKAAIRLAKKNGWRFKVMTEVEIRNHFMENAKFLLSYMQQEPNEHYEALIFDTLDKMYECSIEEILVSLFHDKWERASVIPTIWHLISTRRISTDLTSPLTMSSRIWVGSKL